MKIINDIKNHIDLTKDYLVQETVTPVKNTFKYSIYSLIWGFFMILFLLFATLGGLRLSQKYLTEKLSFIPYFVAFVVLVISAIIVWSVVTKMPKSLREKDEIEK